MSASDALWKMPLEENGGLTAISFEGLLSHLDRALADPDCCEGTAREFIQKHIASRDGRTCERIREAIVSW